VISLCGRIVGIPSKSFHAQEDLNTEIQDDVLEPIGDIERYDG
jgi:hypothetical protein